MRKLRAIFIVALALLILPWGPYLAGPAFAGQQGPATIITPQNEVFRVVNQTELAAIPVKICAKTVLTGSPCGLDLVLPAALQDIAAVQSGNLPRHWQNVVGQGRTPMPTRGPPRTL